ncbi:MAG TPA: HD-GYP domain-containing protein [Candidatus Dormibacteraeota bacterium]|jgi:HD-GYP domain-containing protein (c-di-GMP phosphodiesterase class II)
MKSSAGFDSEQLVFALAAAAEARDPYTVSHAQRVANSALHVGTRLGLHEADLVALYRGGRIHDIGKIALPDAILLKPGPLNAEEERQMRAHPVIGESIVKPLPSAANLLPIVRHHHERFDGGGYPDGLCGHKIPLLARIVSVCDAYDALASDRPYRARRDSEEAIETLMRGAGQQWDRELVSILLSELPVIHFEVAS